MPSFINTTWSQVLNTGQNLVAGLVFTGGFVFALTNTSPAQLIKLDPAHPSAFTSITFANDGNHNSGADLLYDSGSGFLFAVFGNPFGGPTYIVKINPTTMAVTPFIGPGAFNAGAFPAICSDGTYIYLLTYNFPSRLVSYLISTGAQVDTFELASNISGLDSGYALGFDGTNIYAVGRSQWIARITPSPGAALSQTGTLPGGPGGFLGLSYAAKHIGFDAIGSVWIGGGVTGQVGKIQKSSLSTISLLTIPELAPFAYYGSFARCNGVFYFGGAIWATYQTTPALLIRIDPATLAYAVFQFAGSGQNNTNDIASDGTNLFFDFLLSPSVIAADTLASLVAGGGPVTSLPPGLTLNTSTGVISGTPTEVGTYVYTIQVTDANGLTATVTCSLVVTGSIAPCPSPTRNCS